MDFEISESKVIADALELQVMDHIGLGCHDMSGSLGIKAMPEGYALMLNSDESHFFWLRYDGLNSVECWDKWACYRGARSDKESDCE